MENKERQDLWEKMMKIGRAREKTINREPINTLTDADMETIIATLEYFGTGENDLKQAMWDLRTARYRVFDWLGMGLMGRIDASKNNEDNIIFALSEIYCNVNFMREWIDMLRYVDLDLFRGEFNSEKFINMITEWVSEDEKINREVMA
ncbi:MAG: hypothetical protein ACYCS1_05460 [Gammaproteobacteria bacterium]